MENRRDWVVLLETVTLSSVKHEFKVIGSL